MRKFAYILIERPDGHVVQTDVMLEAELRAFSPHIAMFHGFVLGNDRWIRPDTDETILGELHRSGREGLPWVRMTKAQHTEFHADKTFRNAKKLDLSTDMAKAREMHRERLRAQRVPLLAALDVEAIRADEENDKVKKVDIVARKKALRDITAHPGIEAATTPEELKAITL